MAYMERAEIITGVSIRKRAPARSSYALQRFIHQNVLPRMTLTETEVEHLSVEANLNAEFEVQGRRCSSEDSVVHLTSLLIGGQILPATDFVLSQRYAGVPFETICLELLTPAAQLLGRGWRDETLDFNQVTVGVGHLQRIMHEVDLLSPKLSNKNGHHHTIILMAAPGEQHTFGLSMLGDFFHHDGWQVFGGPGYRLPELLDTLKYTPIDCLGLSVSNERCVEAAADVVRQARNTSCNPALKVLVGGHLCNSDQSLLRAVNADAQASDALDAVRVAKLLTPKALLTSSPR